MIPSELMLVPAHHLAVTHTIILHIPMNKAHNLQFPRLHCSSLSVSSSYMDTTEETNIIISKWHLPSVLRQHNKPSFPWTSSPQDYKTWNMLLLLCKRPIPKCDNLLSNYSPGARWFKRVLCAKLICCDSRTRQREQLNSKKGEWKIIFKKLNLRLNDLNISLVSKWNGTPD